MAASKLPKLVVGGLYTTRNDDGYWQVLKILAMDRSTVQVRLYTNRYRIRPKRIRPASLRLEMTLEDLQRGVIAIGVGCMPIARRTFSKERIYFLRQDPVTREELEEL